MKGNPLQSIFNWSLLKISILIGTNKHPFLMILIFYFSKKKQLASIHLIWQQSNMNQQSILFVNINIQQNSEEIVIKQCQQTSLSTIFDRLENQKSVLSDVEVHIISSLVCYVWSEVPPHKGVPVPIVFSVQFVFQMGCDLLDCVHLVQGVPRDAQNLGLQLRRYVLALYHRLALTNLCH